MSERGGPSQSGGDRPAIDWGIGEYELFAAELEPAAVETVRVAALAPGEAVLDVACGTGNAALLAARAGAITTGIDAAGRLVEVARARAAEAGLEANFLQGDLHDLGPDDHRFDAVLSVFGVIFGDPTRALPEILRVLRPEGRAALAVWVPGSPVDRLIAMVMGTIAKITGGALPPPFPWHQAEAVGRVLGDSGAAEVAFDGAIHFTANSAEAYYQAQLDHHPLAIASRGIIQQAGQVQDVEEQALAILREANGDPDAFRVTSRYRVITIRPS